ncbi:MAG: hypothetical protein ABIJ25_02850 [Pseudomonadota bacterium]|jgi:hypothetical protein
MPIPRRGIKNIRTLSGRGGRVFLPHKAYMRLSHIELERIRRDTEKKRAGQLIVDIDACVQEIDDEKALLLQALGKNEKRSLNPRPQPGPRRSCGGFKIRY